MLALVVQIFYILAQFFYINYFSYGEPILPRTVFTYTNDNFQHEMNIYKTNNNSKKYLICLSGSYNLQYSFYTFGHLKWDKIPLKKGSKLGLFIPA